MQKYFFCCNGQIWLLKIKKSRKTIVYNKKQIYLCIAFERCPDGGIGRRAGLKHQWIHFHPGSTPGLGTKQKESAICWFFFLHISTFMKRYLLPRFYQIWKKSCRACFVFYTIFAETNFKKWKHTYIRYCLRQHRLTWRRLYWAF